MEIVIICALVLAVLILHRPVTDFAHRLYVGRQYKLFLSKETFYHSIVSRHLKY